MEAKKMIRSKFSLSNLLMAGAVTAMLVPSSFAQSPRDQRVYGQRQGYANRVVEGTVQSIAHDRYGDHVRLTSGMDLIVPAAITGTYQGRRYGATSLQPGDTVRMNVYSREGDGRDAEVRSLELLSRNAGYGNDNVWGADRRLNGTVVSVNRRARSMVVRTDRGRTINVDLGNNGRGRNNFRAGDRVSISGRMDRNIVIADDIRYNR
jgi:hypothetical protein